MHELFGVDGMIFGVFGFWDYSIYSRRNAHFSKNVPTIGQRVESPTVKVTTMP